MYVKTCNKTLLFLSTSSVSIVANYIFIINY